MSSIFNKLNGAGPVMDGSLAQYDFAYNTSFTSDQEVKKAIQKDNRLVGLLFRNLFDKDDQKGNGELELGYYFLPALNQVVTNAKFLAFHGMHLENEMRPLFRKEKVDVWQASKYIAGSFEGMNFELSDLSGIEGSYSGLETSAGDGAFYHFIGQVVKAELKDALQGTIHVIPKDQYAYLVLPEEKKITTKHAEFDACFEVYVTGEGEASLSNYLTEKAMKLMVDAFKKDNFYSLVIEDHAFYYAINRQLGKHNGLNVNAYESILIHASSEKEVNALSVPMYADRIRRFLANYLELLACMDEKVWSIL